jgi:hypothetical protein
MRSVHQCLGTIRENPWTCCTVSVHLRCVTMLFLTKLCRQQKPGDPSERERWKERGDKTEANLPCVPTVPTAPKLIVVTYSATVFELPLDSYFCP